MWFFPRRFWTIKALQGGFWSVWSVNESVTEVFVEQPLASPGSVNYLNMASTSLPVMKKYGMTRHFCNFDNSSPLKQISKTYNSLFTQYICIYICALEIIIFASPQYFIRHNQNPLQFCTIWRSMGVKSLFSDTFRVLCPPQFFLPPILILRENLNFSYLKMLCLGF